MDPSDTHLEPFEPSRDFVPRTMDRVFALEEARRRSPWSRFVRWGPVRHGLPAAGTLIGVANLVRLYWAVFAPGVCG